VGERMMGSTLQMLGNLNDARFHMERAISRHSSEIVQPHFIRFNFDQRVMAQSTLAEILWLQGLPDQALATAETNVEEALLIQHPASLSVALGQSACPVALWSGDLAAAERFLTMLIDASAEHGFDQWHAWTSCLNSFRGVLLIKQGNLAEGLDVLRVALTSDPYIRFFRHLSFRCDFAEVLCRVGEIEQGLNVVDEALQKSDETDERWCVAELLRIKAELVLRYDGPAAKADAERYFRESLDWAKKQGALSWELRTATSLAGYLQSQGRGAEGQATLMQIYSKFTEGFRSTDLLNAMTCLKVLRNSIGD
jgi:predicted ATPase